MFSADHHARFAPCPPPFNMAADAGWVWGKTGGAFGNSGREAGMLTAGGYRTSPRYEERAPAARQGMPAKIACPGTPPLGLCATNNRDLRAERFAASANGKRSRAVTRRSREESDT